MEYTYDKLAEIKVEVCKIENFMNESINWVERTQNVIDKEPLITKIKTQRRQIRTLIPRVTEKPTVAFFGASQCGKSHLVKNLLKDEKGEFKIHDYSNNNYVDFLEFINPDGKQNEATALVTRFQYANSSFHKEYPLKFEMLSVKDLVLVLIDGYATLGPIDKIEIPSEENLRDLLKALKSIPSTSIKPIISEDEIYEIRGYLEKYKKKELNLLLYQLDNNNYWEIFAANTSKLNSDILSKLVAILWFDQDSLTKLFINLLESLTICEYSKICYSNFDIIFKQLPNEYNEKFTTISNILDVEILKGFSGGQHKLFSIITSSQKKVELPAHLICAITKEVSLCIKKNDAGQSSILDYIDILDFPGCRKGTEFTSINTIPNEQLLEIIKRGKVNYLFNSYSDNYQINNLAIVSSLSRQLDLGSLVPHILYPWITNYIGSSSTERHEYLKKVDTNIPPLFIVLSYFNEIITFGTKNETKNPKMKVDKALGTRLKEDIYSDYSWMKDWGLNDIRTFKNFYLLRDFTYCDLYDKNSNSEIQINEKYLDYFKNVKEEFIQHPNSSIIFDDPNFNFDEASLPNKDGSQLIINQLQKVKSNRFKTDNIVLKSEKAFITVKQELEIYKKSDNEADRINEIKGQTNDVINRILALVNDDINVGFLTDQLSTDENEIYHVVYAIVKNKDFGHVHLLRKYFPFFLQYPRLKELNSYKERIDYLAIELRKDQKETEAYLTDLGYDVELLLNQNVDVMEDKALYIANKAKSFWIENQLNIENFKSDKKALTSGFLQLIMHNLKDNFERLKLSDKIANHIRPFVGNIGGHIDDVIPMISNIITGIINNHVLSFGWEYVEDEERRRLIKLCNEHGIEILDSLVNEKKDEIKDHDIPKLFDYLNNYAGIVNNLQKNDIEKIKINPYISGYRKWIDMCNLSLMSTVETKNYDVKSNQELIGILDESKNINIL